MEALAAAVRGVFAARLVFALEDSIIEIFGAKPKLVSLG